MQLGIVLYLVYTEILVRILMHVLIFHCDVCFVLFCFCMTSCVIFCELNDHREDVKLRCQMGNRYIHTVIF